MTNKELAAKIQRLGEYLIKNAENIAGNDKSEEIEDLVIKAYISPMDIDITFEKGVSIG